MAWDIGPKPEVLTVKRRQVIAGQFEITATVRYPGEESRPITFVGSVYGSPGPIVMMTERGQTFVDSPERFGAKFDRAWVLAFFGDDTDDDSERDHVCDTCRSRGPGLCDDTRDRDDSERDS